MKVKLFFIITLLLFTLCNVDAQSTQCKGITKAGARCKNKTTNSNGYCHMHQAQVQTSVADSTKTKSVNTTSKSNAGETKTVQKTESTARRTVSVQCSATTKAGTRCKNKTYSANGKCHVHGGN